MDFPGDSSWHKGLITGILIYLIALRLKGIPLLRSLDFLAPAIPLGHGIGRIGCFLAGDGCYGVPTNLPWGMSFPEGAAPTLIKVHPVPLYETLILSGIFVLLLIIKRKKLKPGSLFAFFTLLVGTERILLEELRLNSPVLAGLTEPQLTYGILMVIGISILLFQYRQEIKKWLFSISFRKPIAREE
jgi:phosphatidylglycerol:prolipoprotein diacylglycerol transferase